MAHLGDAEGGGVEGAREVGEPLEDMEGRNVGEGKGVAGGEERGGLGLVQGAHGPVRGRPLEEDAIGLVRKGGAACR